MFLSDISIKRPIMMSMFLIVFLIFGGLAYLGMALDLFPDVDIPYVTIQTVYAGAGPKEVETQVTKKLEDAISSVSKIKKITSYSMEGVSFVMIEFDLDKDVDIANQEVKDKVDKIINDLPDDAELPTVEKFNIQEKPILQIVFSGNYSPTELWDFADKRLKDRFSQIKGVARAEVSGGQEREIQVALNNRAIFENKISLSQLSGILEANNLDLPGGTFKKRTQDYTVRLDGEFNNLEELKQIEIPTMSGPKKLRDLADVRDAGAEVRERSTYFNFQKGSKNDNIVLLNIVKNSEGNTVEIVEEAKKLINELRESLPEGSDLEVVTDKSIFIRSTVNDTISNIVMGIILTGLVLLLFLHDIRSTIIVALAMPMSIISAFLLMGMFDFTKNIMTLMGLSTAVGVLVSNSVVVLENIFRKKREGLNRKKAAAVGTSQVVVAVLAATATNIAVFLPVANMSSLVGQFFQQFALTVTFATLFSLLISFTLTPMMASLIIPEDDPAKKKKGIGDFIEGLLEKMESGYKKIIRVMLTGKLRSFIVVVVSTLVLIGTFMMAPYIGFELFPIFDEGDIRIEVEMPLGYNLDETAGVIETIENRLKEDKDVSHVLTQLGKINDISSGTNMAVMSVKLNDAETRTTSTEQTASQFIKDFSDIPNIRLRIQAVSSGGDDGGQAPISFFLKGQDSDVLEELKAAILDSLGTVEGLINLNTSSRIGRPEMSIIPDRKKLTDAGLTVYDLAFQLRGALTGLVSTQYRSEGEEYDLRVLAEDEKFDTPEKIQNLPISANGINYTLGQLTKIEFTEGLSKVMHLDKFTSIQFDAASAPGYPMGSVMSDITLKLENLDLPNGYKIEWGGNAEMLNETIFDMLFTLALAIVLTYMLLAAILENLFQPLIVMGTFPLALIGVIWGLLLTGLTMNIVSMMAVVMLLGIVVNNAILILDYVNVLVKEEGMSVSEALIEACPAKIRPILMSSIAIILGMVPMALGMGDAGREMRQPMGVVSIGGLVVSTILTLIVIPAIYHLLTRNKKKQEITE